MKKSWIVILVLIILIILVGLFIVFKVIYGNSTSGRYEIDPTVKKQLTNLLNNTDILDCNNIKDTCMDLKDNLSNMDSPNFAQRTVCYRNLAIKNNCSSFCEKVLNNMEPFSFITFRANCYLEIAINTNNSSLCNQATMPDMINDTELLRRDDYDSKVLRNFKSRNMDPNVFSKDYCYVMLAVVKNDSSFCSGVSELRRTECYNDPKAVFN